MEQGRQKDFALRRRGERERFVVVEEMKLSMYNKKERGIETKKGDIVIQGIKPRPGQEISKVTHLTK